MTSDSPFSYMITDIRAIDTLPENLTMLTIRVRGVSRIPSLVRFKSLIVLNCRNNDDIEQFAGLPESLTVFDCSGNSIVELPELPLLEELRCEYNQLKSLPHYPNLVELRCDSNRISELPKFGKRLQALMCSQNPLYSLPDLSSCPLVMLECSEAGLRSLPELPSTLEELYVPLNNIESLPPLPPNLRILHVNCNYLTELPDIRQLETLSCAGNSLSWLPEIGDLSVLHSYANDNMPEVFHHDGDIYPDTISRMNSASRVLDKFRDVFWAMKFKKRFRDWLWIRVRQPAMLEKYRPSNFAERFVGKEGMDFEEVITLFNDWL